MSTYRIGVEAAARSAGTLESLSGQGTKSPEGSFQAVFDRLTKWIPGDTGDLRPRGDIAQCITSATLGSLPCCNDRRNAAVYYWFSFSTGNRLTWTVWVSAILGAGAFTIWSLSAPINGWQNISR